MVNRRDWLRSAFTGAAALGAKPLAAAAAAVRGDEVFVRKQPDSAACDDWATHLRSLGFRVRIEECPDLDTVKQQLGIPRDLWTCHTAVVRNYVIEGPVPGDLIQRLLKERPRIAGLAVPGRPAGSLGMEGSPPQPYDVIAFRPDGRTYTYARRPLPPTPPTPPT